MTTPQRIFELAYAFRMSRVLLSAVELYVFSALEEPLDAASLAQHIGMHERGACDFFDSLVALDLLERDATGRYRSAPDCTKYLDRRQWRCARIPGHARLPERELLDSRTAHGRAAMWTVRARWIRSVPQ